jgi:serine protease Do
VFDQLEAVLAQVHERVGPAVVRIGRGPGRGSGFVHEPGVVVTNAHNLRGSTTTVTFADGRLGNAAVVGVDQDRDLAALRIDTADAPALGGGEPGVTLRVGTVVFGVAAAPAGPRTTFGTISALGQAFRSAGSGLHVGAVEHTAVLGPGSSGGPLVDAEGRLVGINTHRVADGLYLAVPVTDELRSELAELASGSTPRRARLGVTFVPPRAARRLRAAVGLPEREGILLAGVDPGWPAERAGLRRGDLIVAANGTPTPDPPALLSVLSSAGGARLVLRVVRQLTELDVEVDFGTDPPAEGPSL